MLDNHRLAEEIYPDLVNWETLRQRLRELYVNTLIEYTSPELQPQQIAGEFIDQLEEQMNNHHRPEWEITQAMEDVQEEVTGRRPRR